MWHTYILLVEQICLLTKYSEIPKPYILRFPGISGSLLTVTSSLCVYNIASLSNAGIVYSVHFNEHSLQRHIVLEGTACTNYISIPIKKGDRNSCVVGHHW